MKKVQFFASLLSFSSALACGSGATEGLTANDSQTPDAGGQPEIVKEPPPEGSLKLRLTYLSDIAGENVWIQTFGGEGHQTWVTIFDAKGVPVPTASPCYLCPCDQCNACFFCSRPSVMPSPLVNGSSVEWIWDLQTHPLDRCNDRPGSLCTQREPAAAGEYTARFCWGYSTRETEHGVVVENPSCADVPFTWPTTETVIEHQVCDCG